MARNEALINYLSNGLHYVSNVLHRVLNSAILIFADLTVYFSKLFEWFYVNRKKLVRNTIYGSFHEFSLPIFHGFCCQLKGIIRYFYNECYTLQICAWKIITLWKVVHIFGSQYFNSVVLCDICDMVAIFLELVFTLI